MKRFTIGVLMILAAGMIMASTAAKDLYLPAASRATGAFNTNWKSDVRAYNPSATTAATVAITYLPMAQWASQMQTITVVIDPLHTEVMENILEVKFGITPNSAGALHFVSNVDIYVESRVYTPNKDGAPGTFGQRVPGVPTSQAVATGESVDILYIDNLSDPTTGFRTNFGLVDAGGAGVTYTLAAFNKDGAPIGTAYNGTVAANQWDQFNALGKLNVSGDTQYARVMFTVTSGKAIPYASQADNASGDAIYIDGTKIKSSGGGTVSGCGTGMIYGYFMQYNNADWEGYISYPLVWALDDFNLWSWQDPTPEAAASGDEFSAVYITPTSSVIMLGYDWTAADPSEYVALSDGAAFDLSLQFSYTDGSKDVLQATWHFAGTFACPNYLEGNMDALVKALSPDYKDFAGKWYWHFKGGVQ